MTHHPINEETYRNRAAAERRDGQIEGKPCISASEQTGRSKSHTVCWQAEGSIGSEESSVGLKRAEENHDIL